MQAAEFHISQKTEIVIEEFNCDVENRNISCEKCMAISANNQMTMIELNELIDDVIEKCFQFVHVNKTKQKKRVYLHDVKNNCFQRCIQIDCVYKRCAVYFENKTREICDVNIDFYDLVDVLKGFQLINVVCKTHCDIRINQ